MASFNHRIQVDLGDILAVVLGVVLALFILSSVSNGSLWIHHILQSESEAMDLLVAGSAFLMLHIKRTIWPDKAGHPNCSFLIRSAYLLTAILGTVLMVGATVESFTVSTREGVLLWDQEPIVIYLGLAGLALTVFAMVVDSLFLNRSQPEPSDFGDKHPGLE